MANVKIPSKIKLLDMSLCRLQDAKRTAEAGSASFAHQNYGEACAYAQILFEMYDLDITATEAWEAYRIEIDNILDQWGLDKL